jgi:hypothetical protein
VDLTERIDAQAERAAMLMASVFGTADTGELVDQIVNESGITCSCGKTLGPCR